VDNKYTMKGFEVGTYKYGAVGTVTLVTSSSPTMLPTTLPTKLPTAEPTDAPATTAPAGSSAIEQGASVFAAMFGMAAFLG
jgi:hypothetical protein